MSRIILVTNPSDDLPTKYLDSWLYKVINLAKKQKDTFIFELYRKQANKKKRANKKKQANTRINRRSVI